MTHSQETLMDEAFSLLQKNGSIPPESIPTALRAAGLNPSEEVVRDLQKEGGKGSQPLDKEGYKKLVSEMDDQADTLESVLEAFRVFDKNLNGTVSTNEFRHIMTSMGEKYTDDEFRELVQGFDNGGVIQYTELAKKMLLPFLDHGNPADFIDKVK
ncbi:Calmodulin [Diplonema papillatum]|nr:Calmodulin [Diplonema papillatum]